jgi:hypothetical protein
MTPLSGSLTGRTPRQRKENSAAKCQDDQLNKKLSIGDVDDNRSDFCNMHALKYAHMVGG